MRSAEVRGRGSERIVDFDEALEIVLRQAAWARRPRLERLRLEESLGRVLAVRIASDRDQPPFDRSTRDGFAVRASEASSGEWLAVAGQVRAGQAWEGTLAKGQAVEIMTGTPLPHGADAVVMVEHVERREGGRNEVRLTEGRAIRACENIVSRGSEARVGEEDSGDLGQLLPGA